jgi:hypothetical protein
VKFGEDLDQRKRVDQMLIMKTTRTRPSLREIVERPCGRRIFHLDVRFCNPPSRIADFLSAMHVRKVTFLSKDTTQVDREPTTRSFRDTNHTVQRQGTLPTRYKLSYQLDGLN